MKKIWIFLFLAFFSAYVYGESELHLSGEFSTASGDVTGKGSGSSSTVEGVHYLNILGLNLNGKREKFDYGLNLGLKITDNRREDIKTFSLTNFQIRFTDTGNTLVLGDVFETFSQYSLGCGIKGISYRYYEEGGSLPEIKLLYGFVSPRWDSLWNADGTRIIKRSVFGGNLKHNFSGDLTTGISLVRLRDRGRINPQDELYESTVYSIDLEYRPLPGFQITSELAFNETDLSPGRDAGKISFHGSAYKLEISGNADPSKVTLEYEKVSPDFQALLGSATSDREKFKAKWRYKYSKKALINTGFLFYRDNLEGQKNTTTKVYKPEFGITVKNLFKREYSILDIIYRYERKKSVKTASDRNINLNFKDRFGDIDTDINFGYTKSGQRDSKEYSFNTSFGWRKTYNKFILKPSLYLGVQSYEDEITDRGDRATEYSFGLGVDIPERKITSNLKIGKNRLKKDVGDDLDKMFLNLSFYWKPDFIRGFQNRTLFLRAYFNDFDSTDNSNDFKETNIVLGLNFEI